nr:uncharacterized protein LOC111507151 [Leptinotarsa decemlineata]
MDRRLMMDKLEQIDNLARNISNHVQSTLSNSENTENVTHNQIYREIQKLSRSLTTSISAINNNTRDTCMQEKNVVELFDSFRKKLLEKSNNKTNDKMNGPKIDDTTIQAVIKVFGQGPKAKPKPHKKRKCKHLEELIDIRAGDPRFCEEGEEETPSKKLSEPTKKPKRKKKKYKIDIRGDINATDEDIEYEEYDSSTEDMNAAETTYETTSPTVTDASTDGVGLGTEKNNISSTY